MRVFEDRRSWDPHPKTTMAVSASHFPRKLSDVGIVSASQLYDTIFLSIPQTETWTPIPVLATLGWYGAGRI